MKKEDFEIPLSRRYIVKLLCESDDMDEVYIAATEETKAKLQEVKVLDEYGSILNRDLRIRLTDNKAQMSVVVIARLFYKQGRKDWGGNEKELGYVLHVKAVI